MILPAAIRSAQRSCVTAGSKDQRGFSLVELMVAMGIGVFLGWGILSLFASSRTSYVTEEYRSRIQENGRFALQVLAGEARIARSMGCRSLPTELAAVSRDPESSVNVRACSMTNDPVGCDRDDRLLTEHTLLGIDGSDAVLTDKDPLPSKRWTDILRKVAHRWVRGDVLVTWGVTGPGAYVTGLSGSLLPTDPIPVDGGGFGKGHLALITDCERSDLFEISGVNGDEALEHKGGNQPNRESILSTYNKTNGALRASVYPFDVRVYYICCVEGGEIRDTSAKIQSCRNGDPGFSPALCRWSASGSGNNAMSGEMSQVVGGIADMRLTFGGTVAPAFSASDRQPDFAPRTAKWVTDNRRWADVTSVQIELLAGATMDTDLVMGGRATALRSAARNPSKPNWPPNDPAAAAGDIDSDTLGFGMAKDRLLYERFVITVALRAQAPWFLK